MGRPAGWMKELTGGAPMKSPGHPTHPREFERWFWREIAKGLSSEDAALAVGASSAAGSRWFRERGGMPTFMLDPISGRYLSFQEREEIAMLKAQGTGVREIARRLGRSPSTISRELRRNAATRCGKLDSRVGSAMEVRDGGAPPEDREARHQRPAPKVCAGAAIRPGSPARRDRCAGTRASGLDGARQAASPGPQVGDGVEPGADLCPAEGRLPR